MADKEKKSVIRLRKLMVNKLLARRQMIVDVIHPDQASVSKEKIREMIAKKLKVSDSNVVVFGFKIHYGGGKSTGFCLIYDSLQYLLKYEPKHRLRKSAILPKREMTRKQKKEIKGKSRKNRGMEKAKILSAKKGGPGMIKKYKEEYLKKAIGK